jgi:phospholipase C
MANRIQHVFVLMLENRSFDHMLGFSGITGTDPFSGGATQVHGLKPLALRPALDAFQVNSVG